MALLVYALGELFCAIYHQKKSSAPGDAHIHLKENESFFAFIVDVKSIVDTVDTVANSLKPLKINGCDTNDRPTIDQR